MVRYHAIILIRNYFTSSIKLTLLKIFIFPFDNELNVKKKFLSSLSKLYSNILIFSKLWARPNHRKMFTLEVALGIALDLSLNNY